MPLVTMSSHIFGRFAVSMPYLNYGGPLSDSPAIDQALIDKAIEISRDSKSTHLELREFEQRQNCTTKTHKVTMVLPLPDTAEALDKQLGSKLRSQLRKSSTDNIDIQFGREELLADFYQVFSRNMRDLGTPVYQREFFATVLRQFSDTSTLAVSYINRKPVAAGFLLRHRDTLEIPWASSLRKYNHLHVNLYMYHQILRYAVETNCQFFDFGRSSKNATTYRFKKQWGPTEIPLYWNYYNFSEKPIDLSPDNPGFSLAIQAWQKLPLPLANFLGPHLIKYFP